MKGVILAGGTGSRLHPLTKVTNKHLLPVGKYPMIFYPIYKLKEARIFEILIVTGREHMGDVIELLGSGCDFGLDFTYKVQDKAGGIAEALGLAKNFVKNDKCVVILGDNIFKNSIKNFVFEFEKQEKGAKVILKEVEDPQRFGVAEIKNEKIISIEEKPKRPKSNYIVTGIYMYDSEVFEIINKLEPSPRGEFEITDVNNAYLKESKLTFNILEDWWTDAGTFSSLYFSNTLTKDLVLDFNNIGNE